MQFIKAFIGGFVATLIFHQAVIGLFYLAGAIPNPPWNMTGVPPLGVPSVLSLAFFGGLWGIPIWLMIRNSAGAKFWLRAAGYGAVFPSAVALFVVFPIKGLGMAGGWDPKIIVGALIVNAAWGIGLAIFMRVTHREAVATA